MSQGDDDRTLLILEGAGDDFRSRRRPAANILPRCLCVHELPQRGVEPLDLIGIATPDRDDVAADQKRARYPTRLIQQAARIVAQVENVALDLLRWNFRRKGQDRLLEFVGHTAVELGDPNVSD